MLLVLLNCKIFFYTSEYKPFIGYVICKYLIPICVLPFSFTNGVFEVQKFYILMKSTLYLEIIYVSFFLNSIIV